MSKLRILCLDDDSVRHEAFKYHFFRHDVTHVYTADQAVEALETMGPWDVVMLDHDLHLEVVMTGRDVDIQKALLETGTGYDVAAFLETLDESKLPKTVIVHSWNPEGARRMVQAMVKRPMNVFRWVFTSKDNPLTLIGLQ